RTCWPHLTNRPTRSEKTILPFAPYRNALSNIACSCGASPGRIADFAEASVKQLGSDGFSYTALNALDAGETVAPSAKISGQATVCEGRLHHQERPGVRPERDS